MNSRSIIIFFLLVIPLDFFYCKGQADEEVHFSVRSDDKAYYNKFIPPGKKFVPGIKNFIAGIVSHHLLAGEYLSAYFSALKDIAKRSAEKSTFIIIGPNHRSRGKRLISLSIRRWKTPFGYLEPDMDKTKMLLDSGIARIDEGAFPGEHSIGALLPFISYYFPGSRVIPIIINFRLDWEGAASLGSILSKINNDNDPIIISADFVHGKPGFRAKSIDKKSEAFLVDPLNSLSIEAVSKIDVDCRKCIRALFYYLGSKKIFPSEVLLNTTSEEFTGDSNSVTSYFFMMYGDSGNE